LDAEADGLDLSRDIWVGKHFGGWFFWLNAQISDVGFLPLKYRTVAYASEVLRTISAAFSPLTYVADSLYVAGSVKR